MKERLRKVGKSKQEKVWQRSAAKVEKQRRQLDSKFKHAVLLTSENEILEHEDDLAILVVNEKQYKSALSFNQALLAYTRLVKSWGMTDQELREISEDLRPGTAVAEVNKKYLPRLLQIIGIDKTKGRLIQVTFGAVLKTPVIYKDELDIFLDQNPELVEGIGYVDILGEQGRSQRETLSLIRLQIDYLKGKQTGERKAKQTPRGVKISEGPSQQQVAMEPSVDQARVEPVAVEVEEPFGLAEWKVYWTDAKFSDNPNQLIELPTDSRETFLDKLEEINAGRKHFQIKTRSVASCIEMWAIPEFRQRAITSRFRWGPSYVQDWSKLPRGPVRIMVKSDEDQKRLVFFAADRDSVYRGVFAGMSS